MSINSQVCALNFEHAQDSYSRHVETLKSGDKKWHETEQFTFYIKNLSLFHPLFPLRIIPSCKFNNIAIASKITNPLSCLPKCTLDSAHLMANKTFILSILRRQKIDFYVSCIKFLRRSVINYYTSSPYIAGCHFNAFIVNLAILKYSKDSFQSYKRFKISKSCCYSYLASYWRSWCDHLTKLFRGHKPC